jgi:hypothetical protein
VLFSLPVLGLKLSLQQSSTFKREWTGERSGRGQRAARLQGGEEGKMSRGL